MSRASPSVRTDGWTGLTPVKELHVTSLERFVGPLAHYFTVILF